MKTCRSALSVKRSFAGFLNRNGGSSYQKNGELSSGTSQQARYLHISTKGNRNLRIGVQGAEMFVGQGKRGVELGPKAIRETGLIAALGNMGHDVMDYGNVPVMEVQEEEILQVASTVGTGFRVRQTACSRTPIAESHPGSVEFNAKNVKQVADASRMISQWTSKILRDGRMCLTLGGDHALGIGTVHGTSTVHPDLAILWIDAHADINTPLTSDSGNMHGMSVAFLLKELESYVAPIPEFSSWLKPRISASNIAYIALRDVDPAEATILEMLGIAAYSMQDVDRYGIQKVTEMALSKISHGRNPNRPIHVSYDIDALCKTIVKSTGTPVYGGLTIREGITLIEMVHETGRMVSMDLVEVNPLLGSQVDAKLTTEAAKHLILGGFGHARGGKALNSIPKP